ncbi:uncharacterized protein METZ01_LOCUS258125 [marine metagenome]|uniref:Uncharacterized protein n=1 Tax=marine metagenome TaxID=408172 RepID=A0A382J367_9ZZZZ
MNTFASSTYQHLQTILDSNVEIKQEPTPTHSISSA